MFKSPRRPRSQKGEGGGLQRLGFYNRSILSAIAENHAGAAVRAASETCSTAPLGAATANSRRWRFRRLDMTISPFGAAADEQPVEKRAIEIMGARNCP